MESKTNLLLSYTREQSDASVADGTKIIRLLANEFCIVLISGQHTAERLMHYSFSGNLSYKEKIEIIAAIDQQSDIPLCQHKIFRFYTQFNTQLPKELYDAKVNNTVLSLLTENVENYVPVVEEIEKWDLCTLSAWDKTLTKELKKTFPDYRLSTSLGFLLQQFAELPQEERIFVFVEKNNFTIIATNKEGLLGVNTFPFSTEADFLYYCLAFARKMFSDPGVIPFILGGNIVENSPLHRGVRKYFSSVNIVNCPESLRNKTENHACYCDLLY